MLYINYNTTNDLILPVTQNCTLSSSTIYYLFSFESHATKDFTYCICYDSSSATSRYNKFSLLNTGGTFNNLSGQTALPDSGFYTLKIYEQSSSTNLNPNLSTGEVYNCLAYVYGATNFTYTANTGSQEYIIYNG